MSSNLNSSCCSGHPLSPLFSSDRAPLFFYRIGLPLPPTHWKLLGPDWSVDRARGEDTRPHAAFCLQRHPALPVSFGTSLGGCQVAVLPGKHV